MVKVRVPRLIVKYENFPSLFPFLFITEEFFSSKEEIFLFLQTVTNSYPPFRSLLNYSFENGIHEHSSFDHRNKRIVFSNEKYFVSMLIDRLNYRKIAKLAKFQAEKLLPSDCNEVRLILAINLPYEINLCTLLSLSFFLVLFFFFYDSFKYNRCI